MGLSHLAKGVTLGTLAFAEYLDSLTMDKVIQDGIYSVVSDRMPGGKYKDIGFEIGKSVYDGL